MTTTKTYDFLNRLTQISSAPSASSAVNFSYQYNSANQRTTRTDSDNSYWSYGYDSLGQVTSGKRHWADSSPVPGLQFEYTFDDIGNRKTASWGGDTDGANLVTANYSANNDNQYTNRTVPSRVEISGSASADASVVSYASERSYVRPARQGSWFYGELPVRNDLGPVWMNLTNYALRTNAPGSIYTTDSRQVFVPATPEQFTYDAAGNLTSDGRWTYGWDAENRLTNMTALSTLPTGAKLKLDFAYDWQGRRIQKLVSTNNGSAYGPQYTNKFIYDGWNLIAVLGPQSSVLQSFLWGLDLSGSIQGAGGVGGLLAISDQSTINHQPSTHFVAFDGSGNVAGLVNAADGTKSAEYWFGPFGEILRESGPMARANPMRFSTKYQDDETDLLYFGYRYLKDGRWLSRDPIQENGGVNLNGFVRNDPVQHSDRLGLQYNPWPINKPGGPVQPPPPRPPPTPPSGPRWYTMGFNADAYGLVPFSLSLSFTVAIVQGAFGGAVEVVYDCADGTAEAFGVGWIGAGLASPNPLFMGVSVGKGLNFIYNLPTATAYAGEFVAVTGTGVLPVGALGGYGTAFTTPLGVVNLAESGSVGSETWGFGAGWAAGTPGVGVLLQYERFWDLGPVPFSAEARAKICRCNGSPGTVPSQQIRAIAAAAAESKQSEFKAKLKESLPWFFSTSGVEEQIDAAPWEANVW